MNYSSKKEYLFLVEGETEKKLMDALELLGNVKVFNIWEKDVAKILLTIKANVVYVIFDVDVITKLKQINKLKQFKGNIDRLNKAKKTIYLLQQYQNFEEELIRSCNNCKTIKDFFNCTSRDEFKSKFINCNNLEQKLKDWDFKLTQIWIQPLIDELIEYQTHQIKLEQIKFKKDVKSLL